MSVGNVTVAREVTVVGEEVQTWTWSTRVVWTWGLEGVTRLWAEVVWVDGRGKGSSKTSSVVESGTDSTQKLALLRLLSHALLLEHLYDLILAVDTHELGEGQTQDGQRKKEERRLHVG